MLEIGDTVKVTGNTLEFEVIGFHGKKVWCVRNGEYYTWLLDRLEKVEPFTPSYYRLVQGNSHLKMPIWWFESKPVNPPHGWYQRVEVKNV